MSDGCEYVNCMSNEPLSHKGFWNQNLEALRIGEPEHYSKIINQAFNQLPSVYHYSWVNIKRKLEQLKPDGVWDKLWSLLYQKEAMNRFSDVDFTDHVQVEELIKELLEQAGEKSDSIKYKFKLDRKNPAIMKEWIEKNCG